MVRQKGVDEVFCQSCGEAIKQQAEICPHCGVRNQNGGWHSTPPQETPQAPDTETNVSEKWWIGIAGGVFLWVLILFVPTSGSELTSSILNVAMMIAWAGMPLSAYFDIQYVRAKSTWQPSDLVWIILFALWFINIAAGVMYLYRRHQVLGAP